MRASPWLVAIILLAGACTNSETATDSDGAPSRSAAGAMAGKRGTFDLQAEGGTAWGSAKPKGEGYTLEGTDGTKRGKVKIDPDRVKVKDAGGKTLAKAKAKDYGFKVYEGDTAVVKVKHKGAGYKLSWADGAELGTLNTKGPGGNIAGAAITVKTEAGKHVVSRDGTQTGGVGTFINPKAAVFLGVTELKYEQRLAAMIFFHEHMVKERES